MEQPPLTLAEIITQALEGGAGMDPDAARETAAAVINWGASNGMSGDRYYWPCQFRETTPEERDEAIRREFNGRNLQDICGRYGVSHMTVYRAVRTA